MTMRNHPTSLDKGRSSEKQMKVVIIYETSWPVPSIPNPSWHTFGWIILVKEF